MKTHIKIKAIGILLLLALSSVQAQDSEVTITSKGYEDWEVRCEKVKRSKKVCVMSQQALVQDSGQRLMQVNINENDDGTEITMIMPLGIALKSGAKLEFSDTNVQELQFDFCTQAGCFITQQLDKELQNLISGADSINIAIQSNVGQVIDVPLSSKGFAAALKAL